ncbi:MAG: response regulator, partial [Ghiorsea sp.]|nr:response regulator [Ghiorsea sp.]
MGALAYSETLQEAFLHLEHARQQEKQQRKESDAVLKGLSLLLEAQSLDDVMNTLQQTFRQLTQCEACWVLRHHEDRLVDDISKVNMPVGKAFSRVLRGGVLNAFDVSQIQEWQNIERANIVSALHLPLKLNQSSGMLILSSSEKAGFPNAQIDLVRRLIPFAEQAVAKMAGIEAEHAKEVGTQKHLMQLLLNHAPVGIWMLGADKRFKFVNRTFCDDVGISEHQFLQAKDYTDVLSPAEARLCERSDQRCFEEKKLVHSRELLMCADGKTHTFDVIKVPVLDDAGAVNCLIAIAVDVTDKLESEREKDVLQKQLQHTQKLESLGVLAGGIAHDFNNILTAIMGHASLAEMEVEANPQAVEDHLQVIGDASEKAADLCKQMLAYSGQGKFIIQPIQISKLIQDMVNILHVSIHKNVVFKMQLQQDLPLIEADASQVQQILLNLITNADEAIGEQSGVITLRTGTMQVDQHYLQQCLAGSEARLGSYVYIEVLDTGCGMDTAIMGKMFDPFFTTKFTGRGLGMSAVLGIVRGHKGALNMSSELNQGSTFRVLFPALEPSLGKQDEVQKAGTQLALSGVASILIVDDDDAICDMGVMMLQGMGVVEVLTASDGVEALEIYKREKNHISMVLLDLTMPRMGGEETFYQLLNINPDVKVILSSGYCESEIQARFEGKGLYGFIQKPYAFNTLQAM